MAAPIEQLRPSPPPHGTDDAPAALAPPPGNPRFPLVDGVRAFAALSVMLFHTAVPTGWAGAFRNQLSAGVPVFFLISGFLLYRPFIAGRLSGHDRIRVRDFARRRLLRIVPAYWVALTALAIYPGITGGVFGPRSPIYYGFAQTFFPQTILHGLSVAWSLSTEMTFYLALPVYALLLDRLCAGRPSRRILNTELGVLAALSVATLVFRLLIFGPHFNLAHSLAGTFDWFAVGMSLAVVSAVATHAGSTPRLMTFVSRNPSLCWAGAAAIFGFAAVYSKLTGRFEPYSGGPLHYLWALLAACVLLPAVFGGESAGIPRRVLSTPFIAWLGLVSYGVFLWHQPILGKVSAAITHWFHLDPAGGLGLALLVVIGGTASVALGAASYYVVERPFLALKDARFHRR